MVPSATHVLDESTFWTRMGRWNFFNRRYFIGKRALIGRPAVVLNEGDIKRNFTSTFKRILGRSPLQTIARAGGQPLSARDVARAFTRELFAEIKRETGHRPKEVVLTAPIDAYEAYRAELLDILKGLGIQRVRFIDEPVAAAIGYGLSLKQDRRLLVVDFGGGTLDLALVKMTARSVREGTCEVIAKEGRPIGGNLVDRWLLDTLCEKLGYPLRVNSNEREAFWYRLMLDETRRVKEDLFFKEEALFALTPPEEFRSFEARIRGEAEAHSVTREEVIDVLRERGLYSALEECIDGVEAQAKRRGVDLDGVEEVLMIGGSTLLPGVYSLFETRFGRDRVRAWQPFEAVAYGASVFAADGFTTNDFIVHDYAFMTYDLETHEPRYTVIIPAGTRFPTAPDFWKRQLVPTCSMGVPETMFKLVICEIGRSLDGDRRFTWDRQGRLHKIDGGSSETELIVPLNESNPTLGFLSPPHPPTDRQPRLEICFSVNADRWLCARVHDLKTGRDLMKDEAVIRLL